MLRDWLHEIRSVPAEASWIPPPPLRHHFFLLLILTRFDSCCDFFFQKVGSDYQFTCNVCAIVMECHLADGNEHNFLLDFQWIIGPQIEHGARKTGADAVSTHAQTSCRMERCSWKRSIVTSLTSRKTSRRQHSSTHRVGALIITLDESSASGS